MAVSEVVAFELWYGAAKGARRQADRQRLETVFAGPLELVPFDDEDARAAGEARAALESAGTPIGAYDLLIAGQALRHDAVLVTANTIACKGAALRVSRRSAWFRTLAVHQLEKCHGYPSIALGASRRSERVRRIRFAAEPSHQSVSAFVLEAAGEKAERIIVASTATSVLSEFFDRLWEALGAPPQPNEALRRRAAEPRRVQQR